MAARLSMAALLAVLLLACSHNERATRTVLSRASFDFHCPEGDIELVVLAEEGPRNLASQIGANGCDKQAVYVLAPKTDTWVLNGAVSAASAEPDPDVYHGAVKTKQEVKADKKAMKSVEKAVKQEEKQAKQLQKPPVD